MKLLLQKLPLSEDTSFVARTYCTPHFEVPWHHHEELELIYFTAGAGMCFVGNGVGTFEAGDVFFFGPNLPHTFQKSGSGFASAVVVQFRQDFWGSHFLQLPENKPLVKLFERSLQGLKASGTLCQQLGEMTTSLEHEKGTHRLVTLLNCLHLFSESRECLPLSTQEIKAGTPKESERIDRVFHFTIENFAEPITLAAVAAVANMSIPAFCQYFKACTRKTYIRFLNEVRIGYASKLLTDTQKPVGEVCFESGYGTHTNFHKQFLKIKHMSPHQYRAALQKIV